MTPTPQQRRDRVLRAVHAWTTGATVAALAATGALTGVLLPPPEVPASAPAEPQPLPYKVVHKRQAAPTTQVRVAAPAPAPAPVRAVAPPRATNRGPATTSSGS